MAHRLKKSKKPIKLRFGHQKAKIMRLLIPKEGAFYYSKLDTFCKNTFPAFSVQFICKFIDVPSRLHHSFFVFYAAAKMQMNAGAGQGQVPLPMAQVCASGVPSAGHSREYILLIGIAFIHLAHYFAVSVSKKTGNWG